MPVVVFLRHGQSTWNLENRFTGWVDVDLSERGVGEAREAGRSLREKGYPFDIALTSLLKRAIRTLWLVQDETDQMWLPVEKDWRLNERHYGALQGLNKSETAAKHGEEQVRIWRRSVDVRPPAMDDNDPSHPRFDRRYAGLRTLPACESLADTVERVLPWWEDTLAPLLHAGRRPLVVAHGNSLRALVRHLDGLSDEQVLELNIPTGIPLVYELDDRLRPVRSFYLAEEDRLRAAAEEVSRQGAARSAG